MDTTQAWRSLLENWPKEIEREGILITKQGEQMQFVNYLLNPSLVLLERRAPDASGARKVIVAFDQVAIIKMTSPAPLKDFEPLGFRATLPRRPAPVRPVGSSPEASAKPPSPSLSSSPQRTSVSRPSESQSPSSTTPAGLSKPTIGASERRNGDRRQSPRD